MNLRFLLFSAFSLAALTGCNSKRLEDYGRGYKEGMDDGIRHVRYKAVVNEHGRFEVDKWGNLSWRWFTRDEMPSDKPKQMDQHGGIFWMPLTNSWTNSLQIKTETGGEQ